MATLADIGAKCAGKTTFSDFMAIRDSVSVYEASNVLRGIAEEEGVIPNNSDEAFIFLQEKGWDCVAERIANHIEKGDARWNVVTGLRTPEELLLMKKRFPDSHIVLIEADDKIRFERSIRRARDPDLRSFPEFLQEDERQKTFGALRIRAEIAETIISNDGSIEQYRDKIETFLQSLSNALSATTTPTKQLSELHRCLLALHTIGAAASCEAIHEETAKFGVAVRVYNTNRALKDVPEFATRIEKTDELLQYGITLRGEDLLRLLDTRVPSMRFVPLELPFSN